MPITDEKILKHNKEVFSKAFEAMRKMVKEKREELEKDPELIEKLKNRPFNRFDMKSFHHHKPTKKPVEKVDEKPTEPTTETKEIKTEK